MRIHIRYFAALREITGQAEDILDLSEGAKVSDAALALARRWPALKAPLAACVSAVNRAYVTSDTPLRDGDELVFIPPLGGG
ncbi:MAG TPA: MoaD/ThiS family protein [Ktedonobacterales bacterium]|nr:MoaD/ThiS family protein [Ktedonobacterales bacterium]